VRYCGTCVAGATIPQQSTPQWDGSKAGLFKPHGTEIPELFVSLNSLTTAQEIEVEKA
jgi:hypothetical protein